MRSLRTPDDRFDGLEGFAFEPNYADISDQDGGTLRVHYLDEGPADGPPILLMHGEPSWCYLYRKMIPGLVAAGLRVIAPDLVGFGRSDKPTEQSDYTYARHVAWMEELIVGHLDLSGATFFGQDWGGLVGLRVVLANTDRFERIVIGNTGLPTGDQPLNQAFIDWQNLSQVMPDFNVGFLINSGVLSDLTEAELAAYDAPFPDDTYKAGARIFPALVPTKPSDPEVPENKAAWEVLMEWDKPLVTCFSDGDPVSAGGEKIFQENVPGAAGQPHVTIEGGGHFLQEDAAPELVQLILETR